VDQIEEIELKNFFRNPAALLLASIVIAALVILFSMITPFSLALAIFYMIFFGRAMAISDGRGPLERKRLVKYILVSLISIVSAVYIWNELYVDVYFSK
tara:strand:- start:381 stop:677 length:297 start_codon:yes stop_codon:yes gene_type:complete